MAALSLLDIDPRQGGWMKDLDRAHATQGAARLVQFRQHECINKCETLPIMDAAFRQDQRLAHGRDGQQTTEIEKYNPEALEAGDGPVPAGRWRCVRHRASLSFRTRHSMPTDLRVRRGRRFSERGTGASSLATLGAAIVIALAPAGHGLGFEGLSWLILAIMTTLVAGYLLSAEVSKRFALPNRSSKERGYN